MANNPFSKAKDTYELVKKARALQKELKETEIEARSEDDRIVVVFNGEQKIVSIEVSEEWLNPEHKKALEKELVTVIGQAVTKAQAVATEQMKKIAGDLNLPPGLGL
jgi:nucleoid-associated protein EbfC